MRKLLLILSVGLAVSPVFAHNGVRVTSQQSVAVYAGAQGVLRYAGGGDASGPNGWGRPVSHTLGNGDTVYLVARAGEVAMEGILAEVRIPGEQLRMSGDARWEMFTIRPDIAPLSGAPDESTLFDWVNRANDAKAWKFPDLSGTNHSSSPEFLEGIEASAARMSRRLAGGAADVGKGAPEFVVCRLRVAKDEEASNLIDQREREKSITSDGNGHASGDNPMASRHGPSGGGGGGAGAGGGGGGSRQIPGLIDPSPDDPTSEVPLTGPDEPRVPEVPTEPTPVINPPIPPNTPTTTPPILPPTLPTFDPPTMRPPGDSPRPPTAPDPTVPQPMPPPSATPPDSPNVPVVPSPATLVAAGLGVVLAAARRRRRD